MVKKQVAAKEKPSGETAVLPRPHTIWFVHLGGRVEAQATMQPSKKSSVSR